MSRGLAVAPGVLPEADAPDLHLPETQDFVSLTPCPNRSFQICQSHKSCEIDPVKLKDGENLENNMVRISGLFSTPRDPGPVCRIGARGHLGCFASL